MAQRSLCGEGRASHSVVAVARAKGRPAGALHCGGVRGQHAEAQSVAEAGSHLPALELQGPREWEGVKPGRGGAAGAAK
jgi:hypothetical protein